MAENNIIIKITSEADLTGAQNQLKKLTEQAEAYEQEMRDLKTAEQEDAESIKKLGLSEERLAKRLKENSDYYRQLRAQKKADNEETKKNIKALADQVKSYKTLHGQSGRMVQQLRAMREELQRMEDAGEFGTQAFFDLSIAAGKLEDQIGDTQQRIRILASDTKELDAIMGLGDGLAGAFNIATSAAEIFGDDMEGLQKAFYKVQAALSIVNGLQQLSNALNKDSNFNVVLSTALKKLEAKATMGQAAATGKATIAQRLLNVAMKANPAGVVLTVISALVAAYTVLSEVLSRAGDKQARLNKLQAEAASSSLRDYVEMETAVMQALGKKQIEILEFQETAAKKEVAIRKRALEKAQELYDKSNIFNRSKRREELDEALQAYQDAGNELVKAQDSVLTQRLSDEKEYRKTSIENTREAIRQEAQVRLDMMRDGQGKEIAQIKANFKEQIAQYKGNSKAMIALRKALKEQELQAIADVERKYVVQEAQILSDIAVSQSKAATEALTGAEGIERQLAIWDRYYEDRKYQLEENARLEIEDVQRSTDSEELKSAKIQQINTKLQSDLTQNAKDGAQARLDVEAQYLGDLERAATQAADAVSRAQGSGKLSALREQLDAQMNLYDAQFSDLESRYAAGLITFQEYKQQEFEITKAITDAEYEYQAARMETLSDTFQQTLGYIQQISDLAFEALGNNVQAELDALEKEYTTDWQEAQKSADKKYITEQEYEKKKAALEMKQAKYAKAQAIINAGINTALAIVTTLAQLGATPWGIAASVIAAAMGAAQIGVIASKPLAQYEKGRKGGKGEYAIVGEKGAELMYVPAGASIVPNNKLANQEAWGAYGVPKLTLPELPSTSGETMRYIAEQTAVGLAIDYDKLGEAVARNIPAQRNVTVNVDRSGIRVSNGHDTHTYLNQKYNGSWN